MFWGMTLEPGKLYTETMGEEVQLSMAAIDSRKELGESPSSNFCQIVIQTEKGEYVLCTLVHGVMFQQSLDLKLMPREKVTFSVQGPSVVYLVGYTASYPEDEEEEEQMRMQQQQQEDYEEDSSAWETFEEGDLAGVQIKEEPVEILDDSDTETEMDDDKTSLHEQLAANAAQEQIPVGSQEHMDGAVTELTNKDPTDEEETIFSVADVDPVVKTEPSDPGLGPPDLTRILDPSQQQQLPPDNLYGMQPMDHGLGTPETPSQDFFYQDTPQLQQQPQSDVTLTPPVTFQPITSGPEYQNVPPQTAVLPPTDTFLQQQTQSPLMQRAPQTTPLRHSSPMGNMSTASPQRTYPSPRRQHRGANRLKSPGRGRPHGGSPRGRNVRQTQQPVGPGAPAQQGQGAPGPSTSGSSWFPAGTDSQGIPMQPFTPLIPPTAGGRGASTGTTKSLARGGPHPSPATGPGIPNDGTQAQGRGLPGSIFCKFCAKPFNDEGKLRAHMAYHKRVRKFFCDECGKAFHNNENLTRHRRVHTGERPFKCRFCENRFKQKQDCQKHEQTHIT